MRNADQLFTDAEEVGIADWTHGTALRRFAVRTQREGIVVGSAEDVQELIDATDEEHGLRLRLTFEGVVATELFVSDSLATVREYAKKHSCWRLIDLHTGAVVR